jgi:DNA-binding CsgD family transcriptional regulator
MEELIRSATIDDFKRGYIWSNKESQFVCLICGEKIGNKVDSVNIHIVNHGNPIERLLLLDKKYTGLTEIQKEFLTMVSNKYSDKEIASKLACAESTVRNMRFALRERARQARAFLAVMELAEEEMPTVTQPKLRVFPSKEGKRKELLPRFANLFEPNKEYAEKEIKKLIKTIYEDDATIRRYLVDYGYLLRNADGSKYYKNCEGNDMDKVGKKELINSYKHQEIEMGIIQISNGVTGYSYVDICTNLYKPFEGIKFQLNFGRFKVKGLQEDWNKYGEEAFTFEVVEKLKPNEGTTDKKKMDDLKELLRIWIDSQGVNLKLYKEIV